MLSDKDGAGIRKDACIEQRNWDNTLLWKFCGEGRYAALHSDFYVLPNGNVLSLLKDRHSITDAINAGAKPENLRGNTFNLESVVEIKPSGANAGEIVWEWYLWDHLVQNFDSSKLNYGNISEQPRKFDINLIQSNTHFNSIDYNEQLDQIVLSNWSDHEIYIIDHTTTSQIASTSAGGKYSYGGDFLFRWGNDKNFSVGDQTLFGQHNPSWIPNNYSRFGGMISIFNNEYGHYTNSDLKSAIVIINIDPNGDGVYDLIEKNTFEPTTYEYMWTGKIFDDWMLSRIMSGVNVQPNGNLLICEATKGRFTEIDETGKVVWVYKSPDEGTENDLSTSRGIVEQGTIANPQVYKIKKYALDYAPIKNIKLCNNKSLENTNAITQQCVNEKKPSISFNIKNISDALFSFEAETNEADSIVWKFGDGEQSLENNPQHQYNLLGTYNVCLTVYNCYGSAEVCKPVKIDQNLSTSMSEIKNGLVHILPNPVKTQLKIIINNYVKSNIASIYNVKGEMIMEKINTNQVINVSNLHSGVYFVQLQMHTKNKSSMLKFIKIN